MSQSTDPRRDLFARTHVIAGWVAVSAPTIPTDVSVRAGEIRVYFHNDAAAVFAFGAQHGMRTAIRPHTVGSTAIYISASGLVDGVEGEAWTLESADNLAAALAPSPGALAEQRHQLADAAVPSEGAAHPLTATAVAR